MSKKRICLAVVQSEDLFYSFYEEQAFVDFCAARAISDEILVILQGGDHKTLDFKGVKRLEWMM